MPLTCKFYQGNTQMRHRVVKNSLRTCSRWRTSMAASAKPRDKKLSPLWSLQFFHFHPAETADKISSLIFTESMNLARGTLAAQISRKNSKSFCSDRCAGVKSFVVFVLTKKKNVKVFVSQAHTLVSKWSCFACPVFDDAGKRENFVARDVRFNI